VTSPYTLVAATLQEARLGYVNTYKLPPMETKECLMAHDAVKGVPYTLGGALEADGALIDAVRRLLCENHIFIKRDEIEKTAALERDALRDYYLPYN
jgi:glutamine synthetase